MSFVKTFPSDALWEGEMKALVVDGKQVLLVRCGGALRAYENRCAHLGVKLSLGALQGSKLTCSAHHWEYDVLTGCGINPATVALKRFAAKIEDGFIWIDPDSLTERSRCDGTI